MSVILTAILTETARWLCLNAGDATHQTTERSCRHGKRRVVHDGSVLVCRVASLAFSVDAVTLSGTSDKYLINISPLTRSSSQISYLIHIWTLLYRFFVVISNPESSVHIFHSGCVSVCSVELLPQTHEHETPPIGRDASAKDDGRCSSVKHTQADVNINFWTNSFDFLEILESKLFSKKHVLLIK